MVGLNSAIRDLCKESSLSTPTDPSDLYFPEINDNPPSVNDPFLDFDSIEDWILEPDSFPMMTDEIKVENPDGSVQNGIEFSSSEEVCRDGSDLKIDGVGISGETHQGIGVKLTSNPDEADTKTDELRFSQETGVQSGSDSAKVEFGVLGASIEKEMEKVSLVGACNDITVDSDVIGGEGDVSAMIDKCKELVKSNENGDGDGASLVAVPDSMVNMESSNIHQKSDAESGEIINGRDESNSGVFESDESSDTSSSSSEEEEETDNNDDNDDDDDDDDNHDDKMGEDGEVEEGEIKDLEREEMVFSSGDEEEVAMKGPIKSRNEIEILPPVPPVDAVLEPYHQTLPVGVILSIVGTKVIVEGVEKHNPLSEGSILWVTETRLPLGLIDEIFGPVKNPYYIIRYNSENEVPAAVHEGTAVSFVAEFASHILNDKTLYKKGYDASGDNDEEVFDEAEFSDDDKEAEYKRLQRMAKRGKDNQKQANREFVGQKKAHVKGGFRKNVQPSVPLSPGCVGPPGPTGVGMQYVPSQVQGLPHSVPFGCGSCGCSGAGQIGNCPPVSHMAQPLGYLGCPHQHLLPHENAVWSNGIPVQQQQHMCSPSGFAMNGMPIQQQHMCSPSGFPMNRMPHQQQPGHYHRQHQMFTAFPNEMPCQPQFNHSRMPLPTASPPGAMGLGCFNQMPFGMGFQSQGHHTRPCGNMGEHGDSSIGQLPPPSVQVGFSAGQHFNPGMASNRGRRRPPRGRGSNFSGGRGRQQTG